MTVVATKFAQLREQLESAAFLVSKGGSERQAHSELVRALITLAEAEALSSAGGGEEVNPTEKFADEVGKVRSRLRLWARPDRQGQINAKILNAFLKLEKSGLPEIREHDLKRELPNVDSFDSNFSQMKIIAEKNHGKIFEQAGSVVSIWEPALPYVREYQRAVNQLAASEGMEMTIRRAAKDWMQKRHPTELQHDMRVSKYYSDKEIWFFTFPSNLFEADIHGYLNILLQHKANPGEFHYLKVPLNYFRDNKVRFDIREAGDKFDLHISAKARNWLDDERSRGVNFRQFEVA